MKISFDKTVNAAYVQVSNARVDRTIEIDPDLYVDLDAKGHIVGVEILNASDFLAGDSVSLTIPDTVDPKRLTRESLFG